MSSMLEKRKAILDLMSWPSTAVKYKFVGLLFTGPDLFRGKFGDLLKREIESHKATRDTDFQVPRARQGRSSRRTGDLGTTNQRPVGRQ